MFACCRNAQVPFVGKPQSKIISFQVIKINKKFKLEKQIVKKQKLND